MFDWNDLRFFLAVAKEGSTLAAARSLGVNQSTVQRRLADLEAQLGQRLVERLPSGYQLTELGTAILPHAEGVAASAESFEQALRDLGRAHVGIIRLTCPEPIAFRLTQSGILDRFHAKHPGLKVEFVLSDQYVDLTKGEADVALRSGIPTTTFWWVARSRTRSGRSMPATSISNATAHRPPSPTLPAIR